MEENYVSLPKLDIEPSLDDKFWEEKTKRLIQDCNSVSQLKEIATHLLQLSTSRQGAIRGLVKDIQIFNNVSINPNDFANPEIKP